MKLSSSWLRVLSGLFTNLSAGAIGLLIAFPTILNINITKPENLLILTGNIFSGIIFLVIAVNLDERIK